VTIGLGKHYGRESERGPETEEAEGGKLHTGPMAGSQKNHERRGLQNGEEKRGNKA